eukprot:TRINITY_DN4349_c0_g1_i2.p2 TRINITY_DN4349_c0_g1~~TRINITY_DN4349_c0_g1_i2.p2  ORF type:complete len:111 (-),score=19.22 TRINITY_DN4349_c0_g1_i2:109-441(-)
MQAERSNYWSCLSPEALFRSFLNGGRVNPHALVVLCILIIAISIFYGVVINVLMVPLLQNFADRPFFEEAFVQRVQEELADDSLMDIFVAFIIVMGGAAFLMLNRARRGR